MTVSSELNRKQYTGDGVTTSFATSPVVFFDSSDLDVYVVTTATGAATQLTETTDYTVSGGGGSTGTVSLAGLYGAPSAAQTLVIVRNVPLTQATDFVQNDASDAEVVEDALDKLTMADQQLSARLTRSFTLADSDVSGASLTVPTPVAGTLVGWNDAGTALQNYEVGDLDLFTVSTPWAAVIDDASIAAGIETMATALTADTAPAVDDYVLIRSTANTQGRKTTWQNALKVINGLTADSSPDNTADYVVTYDASASLPKKVLLKNIKAAAPTRTTYTSGSGTYSTPTGATRLVVRMAGGGGGGGAGSSNAGSNGNDTTFGTLTAAKGSGGATSGGAGGSGGAGTNGDLNLTGGSGDNGANFAGSCMGGAGGSNAFGGAPGSNWQTSANSAGSSAAANTGAGGAGGTAAANTAGAGGGAGAYVEKVITSPSASYSYAVGAGGNGGSAGGGAGGNGGAGVIIVDEFYD